MSSLEALEANIKIRDGKKWKKRFCVLETPGPSGTPSDGALLNVYKNVKFTRKPGPKRRVYRIDGFYGLESGFLLDKESRTLAIICQSSVIVLAFDSDLTLHTWELWMWNLYGHGCQYSVYIIESPLALSMIRNINARLHLRDNRFCLVVDTPPRIALELNFREIRRYGAFENKFCVEAGTRTGPLAGSYVFRTGHRDQMAFTFRLAAQGELHQYLASDNSNNDRLDVPDVNVMYGSVGSAKYSAAMSHGFRSSDMSMDPGSSGSYCDWRPRLRSASGQGPSVVSPSVHPHSPFDFGQMDTVDSQKLELCETTMAGSGSQVSTQCHRSSSEMVVRAHGTMEAPSKARTASPQPNYVNQTYLDSLDCYYNADHVVSIVSATESKCGQAEPKIESKVSIGGYMPMAPRRYVYEDMNPSVAGAMDLPRPNDGACSISSEIFVKPFEPLILRKDNSGTFSWSASTPDWKASRKFSLPATLMTDRPPISVSFVRRFSLEEERRARSESPLSTISVDGGLATVFRSKGSSPKDLLYNGAAKAKALFETFLRRGSLRKMSAISNIGSEPATDDGRLSRACSEPPVTLVENALGRSCTPGERTRRELSRSSLDLDEVVYDIGGSTKSSQQVPACVLKQIGLKPLVPDTACQSASSSVKLPIGPMLSCGTDSTRSSDSTNAAAGNDLLGDRNSVHDSVSVGSDNSDTDSVFANRTVRKKHLARIAAVDGAKATEKTDRKTGKTLLTSLNCTSSPMSALEPHRLSINGQRRLHHSLTKPLVGSYSRYDGDGSSESPLISPSVLLPAGRSLTRANSAKQPTILTRHSQNYAKFELGSGRTRIGPSKAGITKLNKVDNVVASVQPPLTTHSPSPPPEPAPPPPIDDLVPVRRLALPTSPHSALPRLEGHIFKFPPPSQLNYAMLAAQDERTPTTPNLEGSSCRTPNSAAKEMTEGSVEYAKIDQVATQAARQVVSSRREETRNRWSSSHALLVPSETASSKENVEQPNPSITSKVRRPFSLKRSLIRRRTSMASLAGF